MPSYSRAPIREALIDIRVQARDGLALADLEAIAVGDPRYIQRKDIQFMTAELNVGAMTPPQTTAKKIGFQFWDVEKVRVFQARLDGFTYSRLAPYDCWEELSGEARRLWSRYRDLVRPEQITRIAVRYINRLDLPAPADLKVYLRTSPEISSDLPQFLGNWLMHLEIPDGKRQLIINESVAPSVVPGTVAIILDIDIFQVLEVPQDEESLWNTLQDFRVRKNEVFERSITEAVRERIR